MLPQVTVKNVGDGFSKHNVFIGAYMLPTRGLCDAYQMDSEAGRAEEGKTSSLKLPLMV